jgi:tetratricopeptide (TPR) repeat protein
VLARAIKVQRIDELRREPDNSQRTIEVAGLLRAIGETVEAINELQAGLSRGQTDMDIYLELGVCFSASGDFAIARRVFDKVIQDTQDGGGVEQKLEALYGLAAANEQLSDIDAAIHNLEQILMLRHNFRDSRERLSALSQRVRSEASQDTPEHVAKKKRARTEIISEILSLLGTSPEHNEDSEQ